MNLKKLILPIVLIAILGLIGTDSFYTVGNAEQVVIERLGEKFKIVDTPGLKFKFPIIDKKYVVNVNQNYTLQYGYRIQTEARKDSAPVYQDVNSEVIVLTKGSYLVNIQAVIQYRISDPADFIYNIDDQVGTLRLAFESVLRQNVQNKALDDALINKEVISKEILPDLQKKLNEYRAGIDITAVEIQNVTLPEDVKAAYDDVNNAKNEKTEWLSKAQKYANEKLPAARADAYSRIQKAEAYKAEKISQAKGDVENFNQVYEKYKSSKEITKSRLYIEAMEKILENVDEKYILDMNDNGVIKYLPINPQSTIKGDN